MQTVRCLPAATTGFKFKPAIPRMVSESKIVMAMNHDFRACCACFRRSWVRFIPTPGRVYGLSHAILVAGGKDREPPLPYGRQRITSGCHPGLIPYCARSGPCEPRKNDELRFCRSKQQERGTKLTALFSAELRQGRSDRGSSPCSTQPRSPSRTPPSNRHMHRLPRGLGAGSWNRRRDRRQCPST